MTNTTHKSNTTSRFTLAIHKVPQLHESIDWESIGNRHNQLTFEAELTPSTAKQLRAMAKADKQLAKETKRQRKLERQDRKLGKATKYLERLAANDWNDVQLGVQFPAIRAATDKRKCAAFVTAIRSALAQRLTANSLHHVKSKGETVRKDRIGSLANAIDKFGRLNPKVLKGGDALKQALIAQAWNAYAVLEVEGIDNAHFTETQLPVDDRRNPCNKESEQGFNNPHYIAAYETAHDDYMQV